jgi:hypothetical protein
VAFVRQTQMGAGADEVRAYRVNLKTAKALGLAVPPSQRISWRSIFRCRFCGECSVYGQGLKKVRCDGRLGVR